MEPLRVNRRLTCILAADAVGYSSMMGDDEAGTIRILAAHRAVIDGIIAFHDGRIVSTAGDSVLAEFGSAVEAVRCATEMQEALKTRNEALPEDHRLYFRVGVNLGDVVVKGNDLLGDGVNVAARLESLAEPGGVCIASSVYDQITGKLDLGFVDIGEQNLKNISRPIHVYRVGGTVIPIRSTGTGQVATGEPHWYVIGGVAAGLALLAVAWFGGWISGELSKGVPGNAKTVAAETKRATDAAAGEAKRGESDVIRARAEAEAAAIRAKAAADAAAVRAKADIDAKQRAQSEIEKLRGIAEADRANSERGVRGADTKLADATPRTGVARQTLPPTTAASLPASRALPPGSTVESARYDGDWVATFTCAAYEGIAAGTFSSRATVRGGEFVVEPRVRGQQGYWRISGRAAGDGNLVLTGNYYSRTSAKSGPESGARFDGRLTGEQFVLDGRFGPRACSLIMARGGR